MRGKARWRPVDPTAKVDNPAGVQAMCLAVGVEAVCGGCPSNVFLGVQQMCLRGSRTWHFLRDALDSLPRNAGADCLNGAVLALRPQRPAGGAAGPGLPESCANHASAKAWPLGRGGHRGDAYLLLPVCSGGPACAAQPATSSPTPSRAFAGSAAFQAASKRAGKDAAMAG